MNESKVGTKKRITIILLVVLIIVAFVLGYLLRGGEKPESARIGEASSPAGVKQETIWTCAMHPQIRLPEPGQCPICGMDLIPVTTGGDEMEGSRRLIMSETAKKLAEIRVNPVERKFVAAEIRLAGKVDFDETRLGYITAWIPGRIDRLFVDYTGIQVKKGEHMVYMYSPEVLATEEELLQAIQAVNELGKSESGIIKETATATVVAARERLRLWGLSEEQIKDIENNPKPSDHITIYSPMSGIVIHKNAVEGMYVQTGTRIYTIADLSRVWVKLDAYESDLMWLRYGQDVEFTTDADPGEIFRGKISFIDPFLNEKTRTIKLRVNVDNPDGKLRPGIFVRAIVKTDVAAGGKVMDPDLAGKWICPMHPDVVREKEGDCPICGMPLVTTESLGYVSSDKTDAPLVIPVTAALKTGRRAVVYVEVPGTEKPTFEGREIVLGPRAGDYYIVRSGLQEGEMVVTNGNFKIDSAIQIEAKPSMMMPEGGGGGGGHQHGQSAPGKKFGQATKDMPMDISPAFRSALAPLYGTYFHIQAFLAGDDLVGAKGGYGALAKVVDSVDMNLLEGHPHMVWMELSRKLKNDAVVGGDSKTPKEAREAFNNLSQNIISLEKQFGHAGEATYYLFFCPMAFNDKGAHWFQETKALSNPFFGKSMLKCGEIKESLKGR